MIALLALLLASPVLRAPPVHPAVAEAQAILAAEAGGASPKGTLWPERIAWIEAARAPCPERIAQVEALTPNGPGRDAEARLRLLLAARQACKQPSADTVKRLAIDHPRAGDDLSGLSADETRARARSLELQGEYAAARDLWAALGTRADRYEIARLQLERFRDDFPAAAQQFAALAEGDDDLAADAAYFHAKSLGRANQLTAAMAAYDGVIARFPTHARAADARFFKAFSQYEAARRPSTADARQAAYRAAAKAFAALEDPSWKASARWYAGWSAFLAGDATPADLEALAGDAKIGSEAWRKAIFWAARAELPWRPDRAAAQYARLLGDRTMDWYGLLILRDFPALGATAPLPVPPAEVGPDFVAEVDEIRALADAKLMWFARQRLAALRPKLQRADQWALEAWLAVLVGDAEDTLRAATVRHQARFRQPPRPEDAAAWRAAWPLAYPTEIATAAAHSKVPPALIHAFIRKESAYAPDAVSKAHAKGLMQLLPRTARRIQADRGLDPSTVDLHDPATNIDLGAWYVGALAARYGGQLPITMAAFNAGPDAVGSWRGHLTDLETALWVELIPFLQAREYVKRLTASLVVYGLVSGHGALGDLARQAIPQRVDLADDQRGVDY